MLQFTHIDWLIADDKTNETAVSDGERHEQDLYCAYDYLLYWRPEHGDHRMARRHEELRRCCGNRAVFHAIHCFAA